MRLSSPIEAGPLVASDVGLAQADVDDLDAADDPGGVLDDAQAAGEDFDPLLRGKPAVGVPVVGQLAQSGQQVAGVQLPVGRDGVAVSQLEPPVEDALVEGVPALGRPRPGRSGRSSGDPRTRRCSTASWCAVSRLGLDCGGLGQREVRLEAFAGGEPCPSQRPFPLQESPVGDQQGKGGPRANHLLGRHAQEVGDGDVFVEDHQDGGPLAVVVDGPVRGVVAQGRGRAGRPSSRDGRPCAPHSRKKGQAASPRRSMPKASGWMERIPPRCRK